MIASNNRKPRDKRDKGLALYGRAKALGVTPGHLSRVMSGKRESARLLIRLEKLMEAGARETVNKPKSITKKIDRL